MPEHEADYHRRIRRFEALHGGLVRDRSYSHLIETEAYNAVESYRLAADGTIETVFRFNQGGLEGPAKVYTPRGFVQERQSNAVWGMQFIWPIKAEYRIIYLAPDYSQTVIGRTRRDYAWIMARQPSIPAEDPLNMAAMIAANVMIRGAARSAHGEGVERKPPLMLDVRCVRVPERQRPGGRPHPPR
jgi:hypothetical protein